MKEGVDVTVHRNKEDFHDHRTGEVWSQGKGHRIKVKKIHKPGKARQNL